MEQLARHLGHGSPPFIWDEKERRHLRAGQDALYFHLYGIDRDDAGYVLDTFPIIRKEDETQFDGRYRTKELILTYMNALAAGDTETLLAILVRRVTARDSYALTPRSLFTSLHRINRMIV